VIAYDVDFNREIVKGWGSYFFGPDEVGSAVEDAEAGPERTAARGAALREVARAEFDWAVVATDYHALVTRLVAGGGMHAQGRSARRKRPD